MSISIDKEGFLNFLEKTKTTKKVCPYEKNSFCGIHCALLTYYYDKEYEEYRYINCAGHKLFITKDIK